MVLVSGGADEDELTLAAAEGGAEDVTRDGDTFQITATPEDLTAVREGFSLRLAPPARAPRRAAA